MNNTNTTGEALDLNKLQRFNNRSGLMNPEANGLYVRFEQVAALARAGSAAPTLTAQQIAAGAAVLGDDGKPIGRNTAIMVADAMGVGAAPTGQQAAICQPPGAICQAEGCQVSAAQQESK